jgi:hypothetical protein
VRGHVVTHDPRGDFYNEDLCNLAFPQGIGRYRWTVTFFIWNGLRRTRALRVGESLRMRHTAGSVDADRARQRPAETAKAPRRDTCHSGAACVELRKNDGQRE